MRKALGRKNQGKFAADHSDAACDDPDPYPAPARTTPDASNVAAMTLAPDWACEIISPSTGAVDRSRKMRIYTRESVRHLWLVDPLAAKADEHRIRKKGGMAKGRPVAATGGRRGRDRARSNRTLDRRHREAVFRPLR